MNAVKQDDVYVGKNQDFLPLYGNIGQSFYRHQVQVGDDVFDIDFGVAHKYTEDVRSH